MKIIKFLFVALITASLSGCTVWEDSWNECIPLPEIETPVEPDPWNPHDPQGGEVGD